MKRSMNYVDPTCRVINTIDIVNSIIPMSFIFNNRFNFIFIIIISVPLLFL